MTSSVLAGHVAPMNGEKGVSAVDPYAGMIRIRWYGSFLRPLTSGIVAVRRGHPVDK